MLGKGKASGARCVSSPRRREVEMPQVEQSEVLLEERSTQLPLPGHAGLQKGEVIPLAT